MLASPQTPGLLSRLATTRRPYSRGQAHRLRLSGESVAVPCVRSFLAGWVRNQLLSSGWDWTWDVLWPVAARRLTSAVSCRWWAETHCHRRHRPVQARLIRDGWVNRVKSAVLGEHGAAAWEENDAWHPRGSCAARPSSGELDRHWPARPPRHCESHSAW